MKTQVLFWRGKQCHIVYIGVGLGVKVNDLK
jgi:hypothetical protein